MYLVIIFIITYYFVLSIDIIKKNITFHICLLFSTHDHIKLPSINKFLEFILDDIIIYFVKLSSKSFFFLNMFFPCKFIKFYENNVSFS